MNPEPGTIGSRRRGGAGWWWLAGAAVSLIIAILLTTAGPVPKAAGPHPRPSPTATKGTPNANPATAFDPTACVGHGGRPGPRLYAADQPDVAGPNFAGPPLVVPPFHADDAGAAVIMAWIWLCWDPVNTAVFATAFDGGGSNPLVLYNNQQWGAALDHLRACGDWTGTYIAPKLVHRALPKKWVTDYMVPHPPGGVPEVGYEQNPNGKSTYLEVYDLCTGGFVDIRAVCMQPIMPNAPPAYLKATGGQLEEAVAPRRTTSS